MGRYMAQDTTPDRDDHQTKGVLRRSFRNILLILIAFIIVPYLLLPLYRPSLIHPISVPMMTRFVTFSGYNRVWVSFDDISPALVQSVLMSEDGQFCNHDGVDWREYRAVLADALAGEKVRGASTIPMQTVKNLFLWNERSYLRKLLELPLAIVTDVFWPKKRIMEVYLNIAQWGPDTFGVEAASQEQFGLPARKLNRQQAALLAVSLPNPVGRKAAAPSQHMRRLAARVERLAKRSGSYITCLYD